MLGFYVRDLPERVKLSRTQRNGQNGLYPAFLTKILPYRIKPFMKITDMYNAAAKDLKQAARKGRPFAAFLETERQLGKALQHASETGTVKRFKKPRLVGYAQGHLHGIVTFSDKKLVQEFSRRMRSGEYEPPFIEINPHEKRTDKALKAIYVKGVPWR